MYHLSFRVHMQGCSNITDVASANTNLAPYILVSGDYLEAEQAFLVTDQRVIMEVNIEDIPLVLMSAFFVYNICYPLGCSNFYAFLEVFTLGFNLSKASLSVRHFVSSLDA